MTERKDCSNREVMIMLEDMRGSIQLIAENQTGLRDEFHSFRNENKQAHEKILEFSGKIDYETVKIRKEIEIIKNRLDLLEERITNLKLNEKQEKEQLKELKTEMGFLRSRVEKLELKTESA